MSPVRVKLYPDAYEARLTVNDLVNAGFMDEDIYLVAHDTPGLNTDQLYRLYALGVAESPARSAEEAAPVSMLLDALIGLGVDRARAEHLAEGVRRGGAVLAVTAAHDADQLERILNRRAVDLVASAKGWRERGWQGWDPGLEPLDEEAVDRELDFLRLA